MELIDLLITPLYLAIFYGIAYWIRPIFTPKATRKYFIPALTVKFIGAIGLGLIYQFYYGGGDTFNYYSQIKILYEVFFDSPVLWLKIMLSNGQFDAQTIKYTSQISWYGSPTEFFVIKIGSFFSLICFNTYSVIALFFALISFTGMWALFTTFSKINPGLEKKFAIAVFFLPSVFFWGSGLMKDSITIGALGWLFFGFYNLLIIKKQPLLTSFIILISAYVLITVKIYILLSFLPPALFWIFNENNQKIKNKVLRNLAKPIFLGFGILVAYFGATSLTAGDERYDLERIGERTKINSEYLSEFVASGSSYNIGKFDGSLGSMFAVAPEAIFISLFRPFIWEVKSLIMILASFEATFFLFLTLYLFYKTGLVKSMKSILTTPIINFCIIFALVFAFGVGTNSGNFGTLVRYKIPLMPFYLSALYIMQSQVKKPKKSYKFAI